VRKSVLFLANFDPTVPGHGSATRGRLVLRFLAEHYDVHLVYFKDKGRNGTANGDLASLVKMASVAAVEHTPASFFLFSRAFYAAACAVLRRAPIDFIFAEAEKSGLYASLLSRRFGKPYFYSTHNVEFQRYLTLAREKPMRLPFVPWVYLAEKRACRGALATLAISEGDAETFRSWVPPERVWTMALAFDEEVIHPFYAEAEPEAPSGPPVVLMVGNFAYGANRDGVYLVRDQILPGVLARHPETVFRFVGRELPPDVRHPNIQAAGFVDDLLDEYRRASVVIAPLTMGGGIKIKVVEGLAAGRFLVATPKAMEGIDAAGLEHLAVAPVEQFAERIADALDRRPGRFTGNWEKVSAAYGTRSRLHGMKERIEATLAGSGSL
jgi:glycosyltransferase involved in cell wall biosynthesis